MACRTTKRTSDLSLPPMKISKFLLCENPMVDDDRVFVLHTREPLIVAEALHFEDEADWMEAKRGTEIGASVDYPGEFILLKAINVTATEPYTADSLAQIMSRMGDWYHALLKWEEEQDEE
jgi:hypothetical protein